MQPWHYAMLALLPFMDSEPKRRTWITMVMASFLSWLCQLTPFYLIVDAAAAYAVLSRPSRFSQHGIGMLFVCMSASDAARLLTNAPRTVPCDYRIMGMLGWAQFIVLTSWVLEDIITYIIKGRAPTAMRNSNAATSWFIAR